MKKEKKIDYFTWICIFFAKRICLFYSLQEYRENIINVYNNAFQNFSASSCDYASHFKHCKIEKCTYKI